MLYNIKCVLITQFCRLVSFLLLFLFPINESYDIVWVFKISKEDMDKYMLGDVGELHPGFSIDCVILCYYKKKIRVLLNKFDVSNYWQLPGGFMRKSESADEAAFRILQTRTGLTGIYLKQFHLFAEPSRTVMEQNLEYGNKMADGLQEVEWFMQRFISMGYYALVKYEDVQCIKKESEVMKWFDVNDLPPLYSDHNNIIKTALNTIRETLPIVPIGCELLPEKFKMSDLRRIYEIFLDKEIDRRNFQRKVLATGYIIQLEEIQSNSTYNPPILYSFDAEKTKEGVYFIV